MCTAVRRYFPDQDGLFFMAILQAHNATATTTSAIALSKNPQRKVFILNVDHDAADGLWVNFDHDAAVDGGIYFPPGAYLSLTDESCPANSVSVIANSGTVKYSIVEGC